MPEFFTGSPEKLFKYWQDEKRAQKFLSGGTRESAIEFCRKFKQYFKHRTWVDIGTGTGYVVKRLLKDFEPINMIGIDISRAMLKKYQVQEAMISLSSGFNIPLRKNSADAISSFFCFSDYPVLHPFFEEVGRILKPEGVFLFVDYAKGDSYWELRKKNHGKYGIIGNINLRTTEELEGISDQFKIVHTGYVEAKVNSTEFKVPFDLPPTIIRKFVVYFAKHKKSRETTFGSDTYTSES